MLTRTQWLGVLIACAIATSLVTGLGIAVVALAIGAVAFVVFVPLRSLPPETRRLALETGIRRWTWLIGVALIAGGVGLMHLLGDPVYHVDCTLRNRRCTTGHNLATFVYGAGILGGVIAASTYPAYRLVRRGHETAAADVRPGDVIVSGTVVPCEETLEAPFTGAETVCYRYAVQERHNARPFADGGSWHTVAVGERAVPFYVEDGTGRVLVDPANATLTLNEVTPFGPVGDVTRASAAADDGRSEIADGGAASGASDRDGTGAGGEDAPGDPADDPILEELVTAGRVYQVDAEVVVGPDEPPPRRIAAWERDHGGVFPLVPREKRYTEDQLRPGDTVTVAGRAETFAHGYPERTVVGGDGAPVKVSAGERRDVTTRLTGAVWIGGAIAAVLTPIGLGLMLLTL